MNISDTIMYNMNKSSVLNSLQLKYDITTIHGLCIESLGEMSIRGSLFENCACTKNESSLRSGGIADHSYIYSGSSTSLLVSNVTFKSGESGMKIILKSETETKLYQRLYIEQVRKERNMRS